MTILRLMIEDYLSEGLGSVTKLWAHEVTAMVNENKDEDKDACESPSRD